MAASAVKGTILVTGANGGLGSAIAEQLASKPELSAYHGLYLVRDATSSSKLDAALARGAPSHSYPHDKLSIDLNKLDSVRQVAQSINDRVSAGEIPPIRALILAAGFQDFGKQAWTDDGLDVTFTANYLGHWLLTLLLLKSIDKEAGRIIIIGSYSHDPYDKQNALTGAFGDEKYKMVVTDEARFQAIAEGTYSSAKESPGFVGGFRRYGASKLLLVMMMHELQARMDRNPALANISVLGVDPGPMVSGLQRLAPWVIRVLIFKWIYPLLLRVAPNNGVVRPTSRSASDVLDAAFGTDLAGSEGALPKDLYFDMRKHLETSAESRDPEKRELVWNATARLAHFREEETILST